MLELITDDIKNITQKIKFDELNNKTILITGASGLIGVYMISCLKLICEKFNTKIFVWIKNKIEPEFVELFTNCHIIKSDITDDSSFDGLPNFDFIVHAAGYGQPTKFLDDKIKTISLNTTSTINLLKKLNVNGKFLFVSTSELYSGLDYENISESQIGTTNTDHPRSCYIEGKRCGESICYSYKEKGFNIKIARLSLAYGPGTKKNDHRVMNSLIQKGLFNDSIELMDQGKAIRTYCYITDVVEMFWNILFFGTDTVYNVGGESIISILELAELIGNKLNKKIKLPVKTEELNGNPKIVNISTKKYINEFKKNNFVSLEEGINKTINWQKKLYGKN